MTVEETGAKAPEGALSMWNFLLSELNLKPITPVLPIFDDVRSEGESAKDMLFNFIKLPMNLENFMTFGLLYFFIVFIHWLVVIPLRGMIHSCIFVWDLCRAKWLHTRQRRPSVGSMLKFKNDLITMTCLIVTLYQLLGIDTSRIYHNIRAGTAIKLFFMVQVLEIFDRLLSASGQDILKLVYSNTFFKFSKDGRTFSFNLVKVLTFACSFGVTCLYLWFHSYVLIYQVMALNVAINSYSNALLTMILSNQFSELKGAVFKRTEREGLFQIACSDLNERFLLLIMLVIVSSRNLLQICLNSTSIRDLFVNIKPNSWYSHFTTSKFMDDWLGLLLGPSIVVLGTEILVDWIKHAYIIRFNRISHVIYNKFNSIIALDLVDEFKSTNNEFSALMIKRTGFPIFAVIIVFIKLSVFPWLHYALEKLSGSSSVLYIALFVVVILLGVVLALAVKFALAVILLKWSHIIISTSASKGVDYLKGVPNPQLSDISDVRHKLYNKCEKIPPDYEQKRLQKPLQGNLENVVRFEMADKRIW